MSKTVAAVHGSSVPVVSSMLLPCRCSAGLRQPPITAKRLQQGQGCTAVFVSLLPMMVLPLDKDLFENLAVILG